ncbi:transketolase family protein [Anaerocolumna xylanovorans]|uniref:Transketolase n=1 Tax=Anaerocolumna xylanovorans DSM 12503 TaxID=1121345 RepID=A0A1M7YN81_9FIRM|nr:transketolase C-terminal domain-containing protein [Anaerocolumna xylanovorans]SHO54055.1 transketolase [Anaerocolumna xylanovorans DSM 12503]
MKRSFRAVLLEALNRNAENYPNLVVLNADSARALSLTKFTATYPDRMYGMGISEADMLSTAAGMAATGLIPVVVGFSMFVSEKPFEQIRQSIAYPNLNVKIIATHSGLCVGQDGATHQALEDIAIMRMLPNFKVFVSADVTETKSIVDAMMKYDGPAYLRLGRDMAEDIYFEDKVSIPGGADVLLDGKDVTIAACGMMVEPALKAARALEEEGISAAVLNVYSIKPMNDKLLLEYASKTSAIVTAEDHMKAGGLGGAVAELIGQDHPVPIRRVGVNDRFGESGSQEELYLKYGLTAERIMEEARIAISAKRQIVS